jgi:flagellar biosynthesis/type III secretory pathway protein FliH
MKKRTKHEKEEQRHAIAQAFNEGFQMGYKEGEKNALRKLQDDSDSKTDRPTP